MESKKGSAWTEHNKAVNRSLLRGVVAGYLVYLGGSMLYEWIQGTSTLSPALVWTVGPLFILAGAGFGLFTWRRWKADEAAVQAQAEEAAASEDPDRDDPPEQE